jgi:sigma-B regulation protein RsbU (phosphoserine phosphatase)
MTRSVPPVDSLFDEAPCGMLVTALDGTILKVNATFCDWVGMAREELVENKRLQELFTMGGRIFHQTHWAPSLQMQGSLAEVKFEVRHRDGTTMPMILNARRRKRAEGEFDEISAFVAQDRNRYERELLNARKRADALLETERHAQHLLRDRTLFAEQMVGIVSHDLRNPWLRFSWASNCWTGLKASAGPVSLVMFATPQNEPDGLSKRCSTLPRRVSDKACP